MIAATGALTSVPSPAAQGSGIGGLDAQLARYEKQLAECVNCASARTPEGKQAIDDLYGKIHDIKSKIEEARTANPVQPASAAQRSEQGTSANAAQPVGPVAAEQGTRPNSRYDIVGSVIDVYG